VSTRKPIFEVDDSEDSRAAIELFIKKSIDYVEYCIDKFAGTCCGGGSDDDSNTSKIKIPEVFAPEGVFKGLDEVENYFNSERGYYESESAYW
jgi:hypothetical protein